MAKYAPPPAGDPRHGTLNCYTNYGCRCPLCKQAGQRQRTRRQQVDTTTPPFRDGRYRCDVCGQRATSQPAMIHHRHEAHDLRGSAKHLRDRAPVPKPVPVVAPPPVKAKAEHCDLPAVWVTSGIRTPVDHEQARRRAWDYWDVGHDYKIGQAG